MQKNQSLTAFILMGEGFIKEEKKTFLMLRKIKDNTWNNLQSFFNKVFEKTLLIPDVVKGYLQGMFVRLLLQGISKWCYFS